MSTQAKQSNSRAGGTGYRLIDSDVSCVLTRFRLSSVLFLPLFYWAYRNVRKEATANVPGLIRSAFLVESPRVCYTLSLWSDDSAILNFNKLVTHIATANWSISHLAFSKNLRKGELWSTQWKLHGVSKNMKWDDVSWDVMLASKERENSR